MQVLMTRADYVALCVAVLAFGCLLFGAFGKVHSFKWWWKR